MSFKSMAYALSKIAFFTLLLILQQNTRILDNFYFVVTGLSLKKNYAFISIKAQQVRPIRTATAAALTILLAAAIPGPLNSCHSCYACFLKFSVYKPLCSCKALLSQLPLINDRQYILYKSLEICDSCYTLR